MEKHHNLNWYDNAVDKLASAAEAEFGVELTSGEVKRIRDELYRVVNNAKCRQQDKVA